MSGTEDVVTEEDVREDGKIKANVKSQLLSVAKRESPEIFEYFEATCDRIGVPPDILLADMLVNAINDEAYADRINDTEISLRKAKMNDIRLEDAEFIKDLQERFMDKDKGRDPVDKLIDRSIQGATEGPLGPLNSDSRAEGREEALEQEVQRLRREVRDMRVGESGGGGGQQEATVSVQDAPPRRDSKSHEDEVDSLFDEGEEEEDEGVTTETMGSHDMSEDEIEEAVENMEDEREMAEQWQEESSPPEEEEDSGFEPEEEPEGDEGGE